MFQQARQLPRVSLKIGGKPSGPFTPRLEITSANARADAEIARMKDGPAPRQPATNAVDDFPRTVRRAVIHDHEFVGSSREFERLGTDAGRSFERFFFV